MQCRIGRSVGILFATWDLDSVHWTDTRCVTARDDLLFDRVWSGLYVFWTLVFLPLTPYLHSYLHSSYRASRKKNVETRISLRKPHSMNTVRVVSNVPLTRAITGCRCRRICWTVIDVDARNPLEVPRPLVPRRSSAFSYTLFTVYLSRLLEPCQYVGQMDRQFF